MSDASQATVAIVGGGLAGLAAGCALADCGFRVRLYEKRPYLGGRASSYQLPGTSETVDNCQHLLLGCCTNLLGFYRQIGVEDKISWYERYTFLEPGGRSSELRPGILPAPLHTATSFLRSHALGIADKMGIARAMMALLRGIPPDDGRPFTAWLARHPQTELAVQRFWKPVLVSALNEDLERVSTSYACQVFRESFLKSAEAARIGLPALPLSALYGAAGEYIRGRGGEVRLRATVDSFRADRGAVRLGCAGNEEAADYAVLAVPFQALERALPPDAPAPLRAMLAGFQTSPTTGIHFWFDREVTDLPHAVLLDRTIQWMFNKSQILGGTNAAADNLAAEARAPEEGESAAPPPGAHARQHLELVVSSSKALVDKSRGEILEIARRELIEFFPRAAQAQVMRATVIKEVHACFSPAPGIDRIRPNATTAWPRVFLAGDWTATGWPATMEGAVRSGYLAAEAITRAAGRERRFLLPDLPAAGLMRLFG